METWQLVLLCANVLWMGIAIGHMMGKYDSKKEMESLKPEKEVIMTCDSYLCPICGKPIVIIHKLKKKSFLWMCSECEHTDYVEYGDLTNLFEGIEMDYDMFVKEKG